MQIVNHICPQTLNRLQGGEILHNVMGASLRNQRKLVSIFSPFHHAERHFTCITFQTVFMQTICVFINELKPDCLECITNVHNDYCKSYLLSHNASNLI